MPGPSLPALFLSHGAPLFAIDAGTSGPALTRLGRQLRELAGPGLRGVVIMSPHWMARTPAVMSNPQPETWHDFGGFPPELYRLAYPAPGAPALAAEVAGLLRKQGIEAQADPKRPFDHGAWVPLMHLFPEADVPVVELALPAGWGPAQVYAMGQALQPLRERGVLLVGTGSMTHNLSEFFGGQREPAPYVVEFSRWVEDALQRGDLDALLDYRTRAPHAQRAHPSDDHFLPLFFALGAGGLRQGEPARAGYATREVMYGILAMDSFALPALEQAA
ncbi:DODA-type extradiol aromatic ring-opening family dioxygenase [Caenimonas terrae]|uniref:DODA-type extradiol aromatic ring-opening family dioxygenase n=1 Tax=Caenimonas terrae TaxID=696074 RepID=A0ABW0NFQ7_9BURK